MSGTFKICGQNSPIKAVPFQPHVLLCVHSNATTRTCSTAHTTASDQFFMANGGTGISFSPHVIGSTVVELSRNNRTGTPFSVRISTKSNGLFTRDEREPPSSLAEGPSCIFVGPIETASKETLEALYRQARDAYYSGKPLIVDDMFDRVELKLRWYGSQYAVKYPRCSLRQQSTYADAEEDPSQVFALASVWLLFLGFGSSVCLAPIIYAISQAYRDAFNSGFSYGSQASASEFLAMLNGMLFMALGSVIGYPIASASVGALQGLWRNNLVALKGACPNCGEEVFAFVRSDQSNNSPHRADCHVCECSLEFRTKVEDITFRYKRCDRNNCSYSLIAFFRQSTSRPGRRWVYGRIYLIQQRGRNWRQRRM